ncbi:hypothetical protein NGA35_16375, partial [Pseudomonas stutzeri]|nr:hypothetical protein [Stutzerimonas stutzeri]
NRLRLSGQTRHRSKGEKSYSNQRRRQPPPLHLPNDLSTRNTTTGRLAEQPKNLLPRTTPTSHSSSQALDLQGFFDQLVAGSGAHYRRLRAGVNDFL